MPKAAIQISGEFRCLHIMKDYFEKNIVQDLQKRGYTVDIFAHCWKRDETSLGTFQYDGRGDWHKTMPVFSNQEGINLFKPVSYLFQDPDEIPMIKGKNRWIQMCYSIFMANYVRNTYAKNNNIHYDLVIRHRTDCIITEPLFKDLPMQTAPFLVIPKSTVVSNDDGPYNDGDENHICDWVAYGTPDMLDIYTSAYLMWADSINTPDGHACIALNLTKHGVKAVRSQLPFFLVEGNGQIRGILRK